VLASHTGASDTPRNSKLRIRRRILLDPRRHQRLAVHHEPHVLRDVRGVVADALDVLPGLDNGRPISEGGDATGSIEGDFPSLIRVIMLTWPIIFDLYFYSEKVACTPIWIRS
jgi:hypothetical protein